MEARRNSGPSRTCVGLPLITSLNLWNGRGFTLRPVVVCAATVHVSAYSDLSKATINNASHAERVGLTCQANGDRSQRGKDSKLNGKVPGTAFGRHRCAVRYQNLGGELDLPKAAKLILQSFCFIG
jgi:hypothetical protein